MPVPFFKPGSTRRRQSTNTGNDSVDLSVFRLQFLEREKEMSEELHTLRMNNERKESAARLREIELRIEQRTEVFKKQMEFWALTIDVSRFTAAKTGNVTDGHVNSVEHIIDTEQDGDTLQMIYMPHNNGNSTSSSEK